MKKEKLICIIPARGSSQRIKNKNILKIAGIPMIAHVIKTAKLSKLFSRIVVTTDSKKIAKISKRYGAEIPFIREKKLAFGDVTIKDTLVDCIKRIKTKNIKYHFCIYPTATLINATDLKKGFSQIKKNSGSTLLAVIENSNIYRSLLYSKKKNELRFRWLKYSRWMSQDLPKSYIDTGTFYIFKTTELLKERSILPKKIIPYFIDKFKGLDVNDLYDLKIMKLLKHK